MKLRSRSAIAPAVVAVIVIILLAAGGAAIYLVTNGSKTPSSSSSTTSSASSAAVSSSSGASSSSTSHSTSSSSVVAVSYSCGSTSSSGSSTPSPIPMLTAYNSQTLFFSSTSNGKTNNATISFNVVYRSSTTIKVTVTTSAGGVSGGYTAWILKNGTAIAVEISEGGQNINETGPTATGMLTGVFAGFYEEIGVGGQQSFYSAESQYFHSTGTSAVTVGSNHVTVTNYVINSPNESVDDCGTTSTYSTFTLQIGTPAGTNFPIVTNMQIAGTGTSGPFDVVLQVTAFSVA